MAKNAVVPLVILGASSAAVYAGVTNPEGGMFAGLGRLLRGEPDVRASADPAYFAATAAQLATFHPTTTAAGTTGGAVDGVRARVLAEARTWLGTPYRWGGNTRAGVDCSGFTLQVFGKAAGVTLPRVSALQALVGRRRTLATAQPGDLVFFAKAGRVHHVGIYYGNGQVIHAPRTGTVVRIEKIWGGEKITVRDVLTAKTKTKTRTGTVLT